MVLVSNFPERGDEIGLRLGTEIEKELASVAEC